LAKTPVVSIRMVSILVGIMLGFILAYAYQVNLPTLFDEMNVATLVVFVTIPALTGFVVGLINPPTGMRDALIAGFLTGLFNSIIAAIKLIFVSTLTLSEIYAFSLFAIMAVFAWMILASMAAVLATKFYG